MHVKALLKTSTALAIIALLALSGCGGGGGSTSSGSGGGGGSTSSGSGGGGDGGGDGSGSGGETAMLEPAPGLIASKQTPVYATTTDDVLTVIASDPSRQFSPLTSSIFRDFSTDRATIRDDAHVSSLSSDGNGGFHVTFVADGTETNVHFAENDLNVHGTSYYKSDADGHFWFFSPPTRLDPYSDLYVTNSFFYARPPDQLTEFVSNSSYGSRTQTSAIPSGTATYRGSIFSTVWRNGNDTHDEYVLSGGFRLTADFDAASLEGKVDRLAKSQGSRFDYLYLSSTTGFDISNGKIVDGQFTASLTGSDLNLNAELEESVRGFVGDILGEFYGPEAEEIGGVLNAVRTQDDQTLVGILSGFRFGPPSIDAAASMSGVSRDHLLDQSELIADDGMAAVQRTANGWRITVDGKSYELSDDEFGHVADAYVGYRTEARDGNNFSLYSDTRGFGVTREFDYFDVKQWTSHTKAAGADLSRYTPPVEDREQSGYGYLVHGTRTAERAMPASGTATYAGRMRAREFPTDSAVLTFSELAAELRGTWTMTADFGRSSATGAMNQLERRPGNGQFSAAVGALTFDASISGNGFSANAASATGILSGYNSFGIRGAFYGPAAEEAGGVFDGENSTQNRVLTGWFGGEKQE